MAKSLRSSNTKTNKTRIKSRVFKPIEDARAERLSAKLMELASQPKPERAEEMQLDTEEAAAAEAAQQQIDDDVDMDADPSSTSGSKSKSRTKKTSRVQKKRRGKPTSTMTFPAYRKGRKVNPREKKKKSG